MGASEENRDTKGTKERDTMHTDRDCTPHSDNSPCVDMPHTHKARTLYASHHISVCVVGHVRVSVVVCMRYVCMCEHTSNLNVSLHVMYAWAGYMVT